MRAIPAVVLVMMLAACGSQNRPAEDDPWANYQPDNTPTYDETYKPPRTPRDKPAASADDSVARAWQAEADGRADEARVEYQAAFRADRWHVPANQGYQDLMLRNELFEPLWREYLDLWQQNRARGDALYFHLRPLITRRGTGEIVLEKRPELDDATLEAINERLRESTQRARNDDRNGAVAAIDKALELADLPALHRVRISLLAPVDYEATLTEYADRAEENPQSGDALALHAMVLAHKDRPGAINLLREGYVLDLPGFWLRFAMAELCRDQGDAVFSAAGAKPGRDARRDILGWYATSRDFYTMCRATRPNDPDTLEGMGYVAGQIEQASR